MALISRTSLDDRRRCAGIHLFAWYIPGGLLLFTLFFFVVSRDSMSFAAHAASRIRASLLVIRLTLSSFNSVVDDLALLPSESASATGSVVETDVLTLFDRCGPPLLRYLASFGLSAEETEEIVQDAFLAFYRHLHLGREQTSLTGWLFKSRTILRCGSATQISGDACRRPLTRRSCNGVWIPHRTRRRDWFRASDDDD